MYVDTHSAAHAAKTPRNNPAATPLATRDICRAFAHKVAAHPTLQHGAVRVGLWLAVVAERTGGFPVDVFYTHLIRGFERDGVTVPGISMRPITITKSFASLTEAGLLSVEDSPLAYKGQPMKRFTLLLGPGDIDVPAA
jgi:hypothetical protein